MARASSMAAIDAALTGSQPNTAITTGKTAPSSIMAPHPAPGIDAPAPITKSATTPKMPVDQEQIALQEVGQQQIKQEDAFTKSAQATTSAISNIVKGTGVQIESIPTPGDVVLPLVILLFFFFLLIPVNGHTRLVWIWLTLTGNAEIVGGSSAGSGLSASTTSATTTPSNPSAPEIIGGSGNTALASILTLPNFTPSMMTGVEDL